LGRKDFKKLNFPAQWRQCDPQTFIIQEVIIFNCHFCLGMFLHYNMMFFWSSVMLWTQLIIWGFHWSFNYHRE